MAGHGGFRTLDGGVIESFGGPGLFWYAERAFADFTLSVEWRLHDLDDNSGIVLRCPPPGDEPQPAIDEGYEVQIDDRGFDPQSRSTGSPLHLTGAVYTLAPAAPHSNPVGMWNAFEVCAEGPSITVALNGHATSRLEHGTRRRSGHIGLQAHHRGSAVQFRNLSINLH